MDAAFAEARNETCGICMENINEKGMRFGILQNCKHCFCLDCIRKRRKNALARSCPECRRHSHFVIPSSFWVEDDTEKALLIHKYKENMKQKLCKYYQNRRRCPFRKKCFYMHQKPDGSIDPGDNPHVRRKAQLAEFNSRTDDEDAGPDESIQLLVLYSILKNLYSFIVSIFFCFCCFVQRFKRKSN